MYLKSIEVQGFKSFANKIVFEFHNGITGIVGPNGSGKSNVADAVRWVLGEQRVKQLRGGTMQDVIFSGTENRKPLSFASVAITMDNADHKLPVAYEEVTVTRRLYRSGESEYLLNGTTCRLKDIQEMFYDTGIGKEGYSIIGQGQIDRILSTRPEEARELFDEATGIVKFKKRKKTAEKKLDDEKQNLLRVNDILTELEKQVGPLERQAEKAKEYLKKKETLKEFEIHIFLMEMENIKKQLKELEEHRDKLQEYDNRLDTLQDRNSYSKTDKDATFMRMKEDAMRNGQTKPGYNLQIGTGNQFITDFALFPNPTDTLTLIPFLQSFSSRYDRLAHTVVADSGYGSEENYRFMSENGMEAYVKYNYFHMEQRPRFKPDPFKAENFYYNEEQDFCICPMGQKMQRIGTRHVKTASGYVSENARYRAIRCEGCPLRCRCFKAKGNRTIELNHRLRKYKQKAKELLCSEEGLKHRGQRCIEPEAVFGQMKNNMNYKRFRHFGKDKVFMDFAFFAIAFNIKKMCAKMTKEGMDWLIRPFYELTVVLFRC